MSSATKRIAKRWAPALGLTLGSLCVPVSLLALMPESVGTGVRVAPTHSQLASSIKPTEIDAPQATAGVTRAEPEATTRRDVPLPTATESPAPVPRPASPARPIAMPPEIDDGSEAYVVRNDRGTR